MGKTSAREQCATADKNGRHGHGLQNRYSCMVRLSHIDRKSRGDKQQDYGFRDERYFELRLYALHDAVSLQMSDEPRMIHQLEICSAAIIKLQVQAIQLTMEFEKRE